MEGIDLAILPSSKKELPYHLSSSHPTFSTRCKTNQLWCSSTHSWSHPTTIPIVPIIFKAQSKDTIIIMACPKFIWSPQQIRTHLSFTRTSKETIPIRIWGRCKIHRTHSYPWGSTRVVLTQWWWARVWICVNVAKIFWRLHLKWSASRTKTQSFNTPIILQISTVSKVIKDSSLISLERTSKRTLVGDLCLTAAIICHLSMWNRCMEVVMSMDN